MDPLAAIGLAGNIITFIEFSYKVISGVNKVLSNASGMTPENERLSVLVDDLNLASKDLVTNIVAQTENEKQLCALAAKCHELSEEINQILSHLKLGDNHSKWDGLKVKWRSMRKEKDIESIERRLDGYRSQISIRLQIMFGENADRNNRSANDQLEALRDEGKLLQNRTASQLDKLYNDISTLVNSLQLQATRDQDMGSKEKKAFVDLGVSLATFQSTMTSYSRENRVLKLLAFESMYCRENDIENAESGTFAWMIDEEAQSQEDNSRPKEDERSGIDNGYETSRLLADQQALRNSTREKFRAWLNSGRHIFHISGKAGSGKSTLMKFLVKSTQVQESLEYWAGAHSLVFVKNFFWNSGERKQMSLEGLYRSLLFEVCRQMPNLIPQIFPDLWRRPSLGIAPIPFDEIKEAFSRLRQEASASKIHFCFFIDGLDEFEGDDVDHWHFARDLQSWTSQANNFKLCVSSRPHVTFMKSFSGDLNHQISIHELTREDIFKSSLAMFENDPNFQLAKNSYRHLVLNVVNAADGVFLWARLAVRSLLKGVGYQTSEKDLKRRLEIMPRGLEDLFDQILNSVDAADRLRSDQLFLLTSPDCFEKIPAVENAIAYSWLEELDDPGFPYKHEMQACTDIEINERLDRVSCMLDRLSRGLLEMSRTDRRGRGGHNYFGYRVRFLHRSAREYIAITRESQIQSRIPDFDRYAGIFRLLLAELKFSVCIPHGCPKPIEYMSCPSREAFDYLGY